MRDLQHLVLADDADAIARAIRRREISGADTPVFGVADFPPLLLYAAHVGAARTFAAMLATMGPLDLIDVAGRGLHDYLRTSAKRDDMVRLLLAAGHPGVMDFLVRSPDDFIHSLSDETIEKIRAAGLVVSNNRRPNE